MKNSLSGILNLISVNQDDLSKHDIEAVITAANKILKQKYHKKRAKPKYGHLSKYITIGKFEQILRKVENQRFRTLFYLMRKLALRIGEAICLNVEQINLEQMQVFIACSEKSHMPDLCFFDDEARQLLQEYIAENKESIARHNGYLFYPEPGAHTHTDHITKQRAMDYFRGACKRACLQICYGIAKNNNHKLNLYSTHSLRHSGITDFYLKTKDIRLTQIYARHQDLKSTLGYIHHTEEDMRKAVSKQAPELSPQDFKEFLLVFQEFKKNKLELEIK